jgi:hypothetical protein
MKTEVTKETALAILTDFVAYQKLRDSLYAALRDNVADYNAPEFVPYAKLLFGIDMAHLSVELENSFRNAWFEPIQGFCKDYSVIAERIYNNILLFNLQNN